MPVKESTIMLNSEFTVIFQRFTYTQEQADKRNSQQLQ